MNVGLISSRYARALLLYVQESGDGEAVRAQAEKIVAIWSGRPEFRRALADAGGVSLKEKMDLLRAALAPEAISPSLETFLELVARKGRLPVLGLILHGFVDRWYRSQGIRFASMVTASEPPKWLEDKIIRTASEMTRSEVRLDKKVDPSILGGIIFTVDGYRIDASVRRQLETLRTEFIDKNKRIV